jgi:glycosyltransferase involved in cell wall biosynthesis
MQENGFDVIMVSSEGKEWPDLLKNEGCDHRVVTMARQVAPFSDLRSLWRLYRLFKKERPDIVHSHTPKAGLLAMLAAKFAGVKIRIHTIAGLRFMTAKGMSRRILVFMEKLTGKAAQHVWPNSYSLFNYIRQEKLVRKEKLQVIGHGSSNGVNLERYSVTALETGKLEKARQLLQYDPSLVYLLSMGRIVKDKGIDEVLRSFKILHAEQPNLRLIVLGTLEDELDPISADARKILETHPAIIHIDWSDEAEYFMHLSHIMLHASHREGFPSTLLQAGAMECPIICSAIEGNIDVVTHEETGLLFRPKDQADLQEKIRFALRHPEEIKKYERNLRTKVEKFFDQRYIHACLKQKYTELLAATKSGA